MIILKYLYLKRGCYPGKVPIGLLGIALETPIYVFHCSGASLGRWHIYWFLDNKTMLLRKQDTYY